MKDEVQSVIDNLSRLIIISLQGASTQQYFPCSDSDEIDARIKEGKVRAEKLRKLRDDFETIVTGVL